MAEPVFSIVIPNWNGKRFLSTCLDSIQKQEGPATQTIVVDNGSDDGSCELIDEHYPWVQLVRLGRNRGFDAAVNAGIGLAQGRFIALLNNDTEVDPGWLQAVQTAADSHPDAGFFATKMLEFKDRKVIDCCGEALSWAGRSWKIGEGQPDGPDFDSETYVFGACAGAAVYRRELFDQVGLFDEDFFAYLEDVDMDFRAQAAGFRCLFVPGARIYHIGSATAGKQTAFAFRLMIKNHFHLVYKNFPLVRLVTAAPKLLYAEVRLLAAAIRNGWTGAYFQGVGLAVREHPRMRAKRRQIQQARTVPLSYLDGVIAPAFAYKPLLKALRNVR